MALVFFTYAYVTDTHLSTAQEWLVAALGGSILLGAMYTVWKLGTVIEVFEDSVVAKSFFGLGGESVFLLKDLQSINTRPKYANKLPKLVLQFGSGSVCIYEYQDGFSDAKKFFEDIRPQFWLN